jgi:hypothetical protein
MPPGNAELNSSGVIFIVYVADRTVFLKRDDVKRNKKEKTIYFSFFRVTVRLSSD